MVRKKSDLFRIASAAESLVLDTGLANFLILYCYIKKWLAFDIIDLMSEVKINYHMCRMGRAASICFSN
jgi:hypothetical protein